MQSVLQLLTKIVGSTFSRVTEHLVADVQSIWLFTAYVPQVKEGTNRLFLMVTWQSAAPVHRTLQNTGSSHVTEQVFTEFEQSTKLKKVLPGEVVTQEE